MLETGKKIDNMVTELKHGQIMQNMKEIMNMEKSTALVHLNGLMGHPTLVNSTTITYMVKVFIHGLTIEFMKENGDQIKCMVKEHLHGQTEENMWVSMLKIKKEDTVNLYGLMEDVIEENG